MYGGAAERDRAREAARNEDGETDNFPLSPERYLKSYRVARYA